MGFAHIVWVDQAPIRQILTEREAADADLHQEIGMSIMDLVVRDSFSAKPELKATGLLDCPNVFHSAGTAHSNDFKLYVWSGQELLEFGNTSGKRAFASSEDESVMDDLRFLAQIDALLPDDRLVKPMSGKNRDRAIQSVVAKLKTRESYNIVDAVSSILWVYEDWSREFLRQDKAEWPTEEVGKAVLGMMTSRLNGHSASIGSHGNCINLAATIARPQFAAFAWVRNCLQHIQDVVLSDTIES